jgi:hypothetical protein
MIYFWEGLYSTYLDRNTPIPAVPRMDWRRQMGTSFRRKHGESSSFSSEEVLARHWWLTPVILDT